MPSHPNTRLKELGIVLPEPVAPAANYVPFVRNGNQLWISGQLPMDSEGLKFVGKCGNERNIDEGYQAARLCAINILAQIKSAISEFENVEQIIKLVGFVNSTPDFADQPKVVNGASDLLADVLGKSGNHARSAVGVAVLPFNATVEVEAIIGLK